MINLAAAVGCAQLENLKLILAAKLKIFKAYKNIFKNAKGINLINALKILSIKLLANNCSFEDKKLKNSEI